jgi:SPP1 family phage portal protein
MTATTAIGRRKLYVDVKEVTAANVVQIIEAVKTDFLINQQDCDRLLVIESGKMPLKRTKLVRPDIDVETVDCIAHEITTFKEGYHWGNLINFVQRGLKDSGSGIENDGITALNECYAAENAGKKQRSLGHFVEITGIGYTFVDIKSDWRDGDSYFELETLDPRYAFVVRSSLYADHRVILGVTFRQDANGNTYYTAFSKDYRFEISAEKVTSTTLNPLRMIPIIEWERSDDRMGVFEREIPEMNRLNLLLSDIANDVDQETQQIWHANDVEFPHKKDENGNDTDEIEPPKSNEWVVTESAKDGRQPFIKPLSTSYDYAGLMNNYSTARMMILQRTYTPQRNDNSGGSTGTAMSDATGWSAAEQVACAQQLLMEASKMEEVKVALEAIRRSNKLVEDDPLMKLRYMDVKPNVTRQKTFEMTVKTTALANMLSHGINGLHAIKSVAFFDDVAQVWEDSKDLIEQYQKKAFGEDETVKAQSDDPINQTGNSPLIDGMEMVQPKDLKNGEGEDRRTE